MTWPAHQLATLLADAGKLPVKNIAEALGKSETSVRVKACREKQSLSVRHETARGKRILKPARAA